MRQRGVHKVTRRLLGIGKKGQATVEYLIVGIILFVVVVGLGVLGDRLTEGLFVQHAIESASHAASKNIQGAIGDVLLY
jgi:hypothetical protein